MAASKRKRKGSIHPKPIQAEVSKPTEVSTPGSAIPSSPAVILGGMAKPRSISPGILIIIGVLVVGVLMGTGIGIAWWHRSQQGHSVLPSSFENDGLIPSEDSAVANPTPENNAPAPTSGLGSSAQGFAESSKPLKPASPGAAPSPSEETVTLATAGPTPEASESKDVDVSTSPKSATMDSLASATASSRKYTIRPGDTLRTLAVKLYGNENQWFAIAQVNPEINPGALPVGQVIKLPDLQALKQLQEQQWKKLRHAMNKPDALPQTITVYPGDDLGRIAQRVYGDSSKWQLIYEANRNKLATPDTLEAGMRLTVYPSSTPAKSD